MFSVCKSFTFDAAHCLPGYDGPCARLHGHQWKLEVEVSGEINPETSMILDFVKLKELVNREIVNKLDHQYLNDAFREGIPTAERMVENFVDILKCILIHEFIEVTLERVRLYETPTSFCEWRRTTTPRKVNYVENRI